MNRKPITVYGLEYPRFDGTGALGLASFDGQQWVHRFDGQYFSMLAVASDGTVWVEGHSGIHRLPSD